MKKTHRTKLKRSVKAQPKTRIVSRLPRSEKIKGDMIRVLLRKRGETLGAACRAVGMSPTIFYYRLKTATFADGRGAKKRKFTLSTYDAKRLVGLINRQEKLQGALQKIRNLIGS